MFARNSHEGKDGNAMATSIDSTIDQVSGKLQNGIKTVLGGKAPAPRRVMNWLHGTPLHHPAHPALVSLPIGALAVAAMFDGMWLGNRRKRGWAAEASRAATLVGAGGALASILTGMADWSETDGQPRRLGLLHGALNLGAFGLFATSSALRLGRKHGDSVPAAILGFVGTGVIAITGYIGGEIVFKYGIDVNHTAWETEKPDFVPVMALADLPNMKLTRAQAGDVGILLLRDGATIDAIDATCTHAGGPLDQGTLEDHTVTCPWHGSRFCLRDGKIQDGPATIPQRRYDVRVRSGQVEVRLAKM
jgi:nitrite reductase/ring-hydroxylating ferredoxin subunit/uncharacterized membrane protein